MEQEEQARIVDEMLAGLRAYMVERLPRIPRDWNGFELRAWLADSARSQFQHHMAYARVRRYRNDLITLDL